MPSDYQKKKLAKKKEMSKIKGGKKPTEIEKTTEIENGGSDDNEPQTNGNSNKEELTYEGNR